MVDSEERGEGKMEIQKFEYIKNEKSIFPNYLRAIIW